MTSEGGDETPAWRWTWGTWGPAACAALVVAGSAAPWAVADAVPASGLRGDGLITGIAGLLALAAGAARTRGPLSARRFAWPMLVCFGAAALLGRVNSLYPTWPGRYVAAGAVGVRIVVMFALVGAIWLGWSLVRSRGTTAADHADSGRHADLADRWAVACLVGSVLIVAGQGPVSWWVIIPGLTVLHSLIAVLLAVAGGLVVLDRTGRRSIRPLVTIACCSLVALFGAILVSRLGTAEAFRELVDGPPHGLPRGTITPRPLWLQGVMILFGAAALLGFGWLGTKLASAMTPAEPPRSRDAALRTTSLDQEST